MTSHVTPTSLGIRGMLSLISLSSIVAVQGEALACLTRRPQVGSVRVLDLVARDARDWEVEEARTGNCSWHPGGALRLDQLSQLLRSGEILPAVARVAEDLSVSARYVGELPQSPLCAAAVCEAVDVRVPILGPDRWYQRARSAKVGQPGDITSAVVHLGHPGVGDVPTRRLVLAVQIQDAQDWILEDVVLDNRSSMGCRGEAPARALHVARDLELAVGIAQRGLEIRARYVGADLAERRLEIEASLASVSP